jgi:hypothetical protein
MKINAFLHFSEEEEEEEEEEAQSFGRTLE